MMKTPRCGVPDIQNNMGGVARRSRRRRRRYTISKTEHVVLFVIGPNNFFGILHVIITHNNNQRFNTLFYPCLPGSDSFRNIPFLLSPYHALHTLLAPVLSCPPQHILSTSSFP